MIGYDAYAHDDGNKLIRERDEALATVARFEALFSGGPDAACRTAWQDGVECVVVPMDDLRAAFGVES